MTTKKPIWEAIKIYSDGADRASMLEMNADPKIKGLTTNPTLMKKAGVKDYPSFAKEILSQIKSKPISFEVFADDLPSMERQGLEIASWGKNVYVKIPVTNTEGVSTCGLIKKLSTKGVQLNVTALLTLDQVTEVCEALKNGAPSVVSVFSGRIADTGIDPMPLMRDSLKVCRNAGSQVELLWASTREVLNLCQAAETGCDIITVPADIYKKTSMFGKDLGELSLDTVRMFYKDAQAAGFQI